MFFPRRKAVLRRRGIFLPAFLAVQVLMELSAQCIPGARIYRFPSTLLRRNAGLLHTIAGSLACALPAGDGSIGLGPKTH